LELNGSEEDAFRVVENLLDAGVVQDAVKRRQISGSTWS
jgi:hypothetical protein